MNCTLRIELMCNPAKLRDAAMVEVQLADKVPVEPLAGLEEVEVDFTLLAYFYSILSIVPLHGMHVLPEPSVNPAVRIPKVGLDLPVGGIEVVSVYGGSAGATETGYCQHKLLHACALLNLLAECDGQLRESCAVIAVKVRELLIGFFDAPVQH